jgi:thiosulfate dehydrogenase
VPLPSRVAAVALAVAFTLAPAARAAAPFNPPAEATIPAGPAGDAIRLGKTLVTDTRAQLPKNVGNGLNCSSCHLGGGTVAFAGPYVGLWGVFPEYRSRSGRINSLQERINDCFQRSMNGKALPWESKEMNALLMYMQWLSTGVPVGTEVEGRGMGKVDPALVPDGDRGKLVYAQKCASCHGAEGAGMKDPSGKYLFPPVWGKDSFNVGAGMARTFTAAAFVQRNMPLGQGGTLTAQEALDVAEFVTHQPRPAYAPAKLDWPKGGRPKDARS